MVALFLPVRRWKVGCATVGLGQCDNNSGFMSFNDGNPDRTTACAEFVHVVMSTFSSPWERLLFPSSLRDPETSEYDWHLLAAKFGHADVDRALLDEHRAVCEAWLMLHLLQQALQLEEYRSTQGLSLHAVLRRWLGEKSYQRLIPPGAPQLQRQAFRTDPETILSILCTQES